MRIYGVKSSLGASESLFVLPILCLLILVFFVPLSHVFYFSLFPDGEFSLSGFKEVLSDELFERVLYNTIEISALATFVSLLLGYPVAMHLAGLSPRRRAIYMSMVLLPFWTSILVKSYAFIILLGRAGILNSALVFMLGEEARTQLILNRTGVIIGMSNFLVPFIVFPVLANLLNQDKNLVQAAAIMGAGSVRIWWKVVVPQSLPAVVAGCFMCMVISLGFFITPALMGGSRDMMIANIIDLYTRETLNWTAASAIGVVLLLLSGLVIFLLSRVSRSAGPFSNN